MHADSLVRDHGVHLGAVLARDAEADSLVRHEVFALLIYRRVVDERELEGGHAVLGGYVREAGDGLRTVGWVDGWMVGWLRERTGKGARWEMAEGGDGMHVSSASVREMQVGG